MSDLTTTSTPLAVRTSWLRTVIRWMITFVGFPAGGLLASLVVGPINSLTAALAGGLLTGAVLGTAQWLGFSRNRPPVVAWIASTALGLMVGLGVGSAVVGYNTSVGAVVLQGAICGLAVGAAQALVLRPRLGRVALAWPPALAAIWAAGWAITTSAGVQIDQQFTVFGASGAVFVTAATAVLPLVLSRRESSAS